MLLSTAVDMSNELFLLVRGMIKEDKVLTSHTLKKSGPKVRTLFLRDPWPAQHYHNQIKQKSES